MKKKVIQMLGGFLVLMLLFTMLSRAADGMGLPRVETVTPQKMSIAHKVTAEGKVEQNREQAVSTEPNQIVKAIYVDEGQQVEEGELLFELDMEELKEQILSMKQEIKMQELQTGDSQSAKDVAAARKALEQQRAASDYADAKSQADKAVEKAKQELEEAKKALEESGTVSPGKKEEGKVEAELKKTVEEKEKAYEEAVKKYQELEQELARKISEALAQAEKEAEEKETAEKETTDRESAPGTARETGQSENPEAAAQEYTAENGKAAAQEDTAENLEGGTLAKSAQAQGVSVLDRQKIETDLKNQYQSVLSAAKEKAEGAKEELQSAKLALEEYQTSQAEQNKEEKQTTKAQLKEAVKEKQAAYDEAVSARDSSLRSASNAVADASVPDARDSSMDVAAIEREQKELALSKLERLEEAQGKITSPIRGIVTKVTITTGDRTPDGTAVLLADLSSGSRFAAQVPKEQEKYIARKDEATLTVGNNGEKITGLEVASVRTNEENPDLLDVSINLPADSLEMGAAASMEVSRKSGTYQSCLPLSAIHYDNNQAYVLVAEESQTVLGTELMARRIDVTIEDKNEQYAALKEGVLTSEQKVIRSADRNVEPGGRIRLAEE